MLNPIQDIITAINNVLKLQPNDSEVNVHVQLASQPKLGQFQSNIAMLLAKPWQKSPIEIANLLAEALNTHPMFAKVVASKPGFLNFSLASSYLNEQLNTLKVDPRLGIPNIDHPKTVVVDYSSPNIAKHMHIGHLRSTIIGDAISRLLTYCGDYVIRQNHIGDWGTQFGMLIEHLVENELDPNVVDLNDAYQTAKKRFDAEPEFMKKAKERVVSLQAHETQTIEIWQNLVKASESHFSQIYQSLGVLLDEADIRAESFYNPKLKPLIDQLKAQSICHTDDGATVIYLEQFKDRNGKYLPLIIQKSDGGFLYATTDLAALDFRINELKANRVIYVVDARQEQHFAMIFEAANLIGWQKGDITLDAVLFGMVLGDNGKPYKTREGTTVPLESLISEAIQKATDMVKVRHPDWPKEKLVPIAKAIAIGSLKYADLTNDRIKNYVFSFDRMLALDGNTAPYLQNAYVRIQSILRKADLSTSEAAIGTIAIQSDIEISLACHIAQFPKEIYAIRDSLALHRLCHYLYKLASLYHQFYEHHPILSAESKEKVSRLSLSILTANILKQGLNILGIETIDFM
ncbi:MAG: arginine--tRNA ligase [Pseudomonadota bacterium]|nr:arginine--tRNA ligase [Pseudomonadota bacterium]